MVQLQENKPSWPSEFFGWLRTGGARTIGYFASIPMVAAVAARVSYIHIRDITLIAGQPVDVAALLPLSVDGMLLAASLAIAYDKAKGLQPRGWARFGFWFGAIISILSNVADTLVHASGTIRAARVFVPSEMVTDQQLLGLAVFVAVLAPSLLLITVEILARPGKPKKNQARVNGAKQGWVKRQELKKQGAGTTRRTSSSPTTGKTGRSRTAKAPAAKAPASKSNIAAPSGLLVPTAKELAELLG